MHDESGTCHACALLLWVRDSTERHLDGWQISNVAIGGEVESTSLSGTIPALDLCAHLPQDLLLNLPHPFSRDTEMFPHFFKRLWPPNTQPKADRQNPAFTPIRGGQNLLHQLVVVVSDEFVQGGDCIGIHPDFRDGE
jgi:hypothetical protein